jgi:hypothetical protein
MDSMAAMMALARSALSGRATRWSNWASGLQIDGALLGEVRLGQRPGLAAAGGQAGDDGVLHRLEAAVGVAQKDQAHDGQEILVAGVVGVGAQGVGCGPEPALDGFDVL